MSPDEVTRRYQAAGYDFLALTDHRAYNYTDYAPEAGVIIVPGMEMDRNLPGPGCHCHHITAFDIEVAIGIQSVIARRVAEDITTVDGEIAIYPGAIRS